MIFHIAGVVFRVTEVVGYRGQATLSNFSPRPFLIWFQRVAANVTFVHRAIFNYTDLNIDQIKFEPQRVI